MTVAMLLVGTGRGVGLGHERRMSRLASALRDHGTDVKTIKLSIDSRSNPVPIDLLSDVYDFIVVDLPHSLWTSEIEAAVAGAARIGCRVVTVDRLAPSSDIVIVPSFHVDPQIKDEAAARGIELLGGWEHLLLDPVRHRRADRDVNHLLVLTGGGDEGGLGDIWPKMIDRVLPDRWTVSWVVGPFATRPSLPATRRLKWDLLTGCTDLGSVMAGASIALAVYGVSALELLAHSTPSVLFSPYGSRDVSHLATLDKAGLALAARDASEAIDSLARLAVEPHTARELERRCASLDIGESQATAARILSLGRGENSGAGT